MSKTKQQTIKLDSGGFVVRVNRGNIYYSDEPFPLNKEKVNRYTDRLDSMNVSYEVIDYDLL